MSLHIIVILSIGIGICVYGILYKVIEITSKKTVETYLHGEKSVRKSTS